MVASSNARKRTAVTSTVAAKNITKDSEPDTPADTPADTPDEVRARLEAEVRAEIEAEVRAEMAAAISAAPAPSVPEPSVSAGETVTVSFVDDGLTLLGRIWYRGQELTVAKGSAEWAQTLLNAYDPQSRSVLDLSEDEQVSRWGRRMFRHGAWAGQAYSIPEDALPEEREALLSIQRERDSR